MESNRREFIKTASAGGLGAGLLGADSFGLYDDVGQQLARPPQNAKIRITDIKAAVIENSPVVRIITDAGIDGYGQAETSKSYLKWHILFYKDYLVGEDPTNVERCLMKIRRMGSFKPWGAAVSIIETALWDIAGKAAGLPIYKLMGGKIRDHVRCYNGSVPIPASTRGNTPSEFYNWGVSARNLAEGFTIFKTAMFRPTGGADSTYNNTSPSQSTRQPSHSRRGAITEYRIKQIVERVAAIKEGLGDGRALALDLGPGLFLSDAIKLANALEPYNLIWLEDMLVGDYFPYVGVDEYRELTRSTTVPIHTGEQIYLRQHFRELLEKAAVRVVGPDPADVGGISEIKWIAEYADLHSILMAPHGTFNGLLGNAAQVMVGAAMPENYIAFEYSHPRQDWWYDIINEDLPKPLVKDGLIEVWDRPGLGITFNARAARQYLSEEDKDFFD